MIVLTASDVRRLLPMAECIPLMAEAMKAVSAGRTVLPERTFTPIPGRQGKLGLMPGYAEGAPDQGGDAFGVKIVSKYVRPPGDPAGTHVGMVALFDADQGLPRALIEGGSLTAIRTAATTAMACDVLAGKDARRALILGAGEEAQWHIEALRLIRPFDEIAVWARRPEQAEGLIAQMGGADLALAGDLEAAVAAADVICTVTSAPEPILLGAWLRPGQHVALVGSAIPTTAEADAEVVARARFFVDHIPAAQRAAGELKRAIEAGAVGPDHIAGEIGAVLLGAVEGRRSAGEITLYKSLGVLAQDLFAARHVLAAALAQGVGASIDLAS
jgi:ornithine cyclodeaminase